MRPRGPAGRARQGDDLALPDGFSGAYQKLLQMRVQGLHAVFVFELDKIAVSRAVFCAEDGSGRCGQNIASAACLQIDAGVEGAVPGDRMLLPAEGIGDGGICVFQRKDVFWRGLGGNFRFGRSFRLRNDRLRDLGGRQRRGGGLTRVSGSEVKISSVCVPSFVTRFAGRACVAKTHAASKNAAAARSPARAGTRR